jgi:glutamine synthetase
LAKDDPKGADGPSCNPYLAFTVMLCAGVVGVDQQMEAKREEWATSDTSRRESSGT